MTIEGYPSHVWLPGLADPPRPEEGRRRARRRRAVLALFAVFAVVAVAAREAGAGRSEGERLSQLWWNGKTPEGIYGIKETRGNMLLILEYDEEYIYI